MWKQKFLIKKVWLTLFFTHNHITDIGSRYDINTKMALGARCCGVGRTGALKLCTVMNLDLPLSQHPWQEVTMKLEAASIELREESCYRARGEVAELYKDRNPSSVNLDGSVDVKAGFDGSWQQRGWTSTQGVVSATSPDTGKVLDVHHLVNVCAQCSTIDQQRKEGKFTELQYLEKIIAHEDYCRKNHDGSPQSMESAGNMS